MVMTMDLPSHVHDDMHGKLLRSIRTELLRECEPVTAEGLLKPWSESDDQSQSVDNVCAQKLYALGMHDALTDAIRLCEFQKDKHANAVEFYVSAKNYYDAAVHAAKTTEADLCANAIRDVLKRKGGV